MNIIQKFGNEHDALCFVLLMIIFIALIVGVIFFIMSMITTNGSEATFGDPYKATCQDMLDFINGDRSLYYDFNVSTWGEFGVIYNANCK